MGWPDLFKSSSGQTNWGAIIGGALAAGSTIYAANQQKKAQDQAYKNQMKQYEQQTQWQNEQIQRAQNSPVAMMAPYLMETLINAYGGKLSKFGINLPVDQMLAALHGKTGGGQGGMQSTTGSGLQAIMSPEQAYQGGGMYNKQLEIENNPNRAFAAAQRRSAGALGVGRRLEFPVDQTGGAVLDSIFNQSAHGGNDGQNSLGELIAWRDALSGGKEFLLNAGLEFAGPLGTAAKTGGWMADRGWFDDLAYGGQMIQPIKDGNPAWYNLWNHGDIIGSQMNFENANQWDSNQYFGSSNAWGY